MRLAKIRTQFWIAATASVTGVAPQAWSTVPSLAYTRGATCPQYFTQLSGIYRGDAASRAPDVDAFTRTQTEGAQSAPRFAGSPKPLADMPDESEIRGVTLKATSHKNLVLRGKPALMTVTTKDGNRYQGLVAYWGKFLSARDITEHARDNDPALDRRIKDTLQRKTDEAKQAGDKRQRAVILRELYREHFQKFYPDKSVFMDLSTGTIHYVPDDRIDRVNIAGTNQVDRFREPPPRRLVECTVQSGPDCAKHSLISGALQEVERGKPKTPLTQNIEGRTLRDSPWFNEQARNIAYDERWGFFEQMRHDMNRPKILESLIRELRGGKRTMDFYTDHQRHMIDTLARDFKTKAQATESLDEALKFLSEGRGVVQMHWPALYSSPRKTYGLKAEPQNMPIVDYRPGADLGSRAKRSADVGHIPVTRHLARIDPAKVKIVDREYHATTLMGEWKPSKAQQELILKTPALRERFMVAKGSNQVPPLLIVTDSNRPAPDLDMNALRFMPEPLFRNPVINVDKIPPKPWTPEVEENLYQRLVRARNYYLLIEQPRAP